MFGGVMRVHMPKPIYHMHKYDRGEGKEEEGGA